MHEEKKAIAQKFQSRTRRVRELHNMEAGRYLKKPYTLKNLGMSVREELAR